MTLIEAAKLAREALIGARAFLESDAPVEIWSLNDKAITAIKEALAQPEQEPVAFYVYKPTLPRGNLGNVSDGDLPWVYDQDPSSGFSARMLVTPFPPPRKPWVGLTDGERNTIYNTHEPYAGLKAIEAKLKEKNT